MWNRRRIVLSALLLGWILWVYRGGWIDLAIEDHAAFEQELSFFSSWGDRLLHALDYDRSHVLIPDLSGFARPLSCAYHALVEVVIDADERERGILGLVVHWLVSCTFYATARRLGSELVAWTATWCVATVYTGLNLVLWRHMIPYELALAGVAICLRSEPDESPALTSSVALVAAVLFHEIVGVAALAATLFASSFAVGEVRWRLIRQLGPAALVGMSLQLASHLTSGASGHGGNAAMSAAMSAVAWTPWVLGQWIVGWGVPGIFFVLTEPFGRSITRPVPLPATVFSAVGIAGLVTFALGLGSIARRWRRGAVDRADPVIVLCGGIVAALAVIFAALRIPMLSYDYLSRANYYFGFTAWLLSLVVVAVVRRGPQIVQRATAAGFALLTIISAQGVHGAVERHRDDVASIYELHHAIAQQLGSGCLVGLADDADRSFFPEIFPFAFLGPRVCPVLQGRPTLLAFDGTFSLLPLTPPSHWTALAPGIARPFPLDDAKAIRVVVRTPFDVSLRVMDEAHTLALEGHGLSPVAMIDGQRIPLGRKDQVVGSPRDTHVLEIAIVGAHAYALYDGLTVASYGAANRLPAAATVSVQGAPTDAITEISVSSEPYAIDHRSALHLDAPGAAARASRIRSAAR